jgi:hypothetical protein
MTNDQFERLIAELVEIKEFLKTPEQRIREFEIRAHHTQTQDELVAEINSDFKAIAKMIEKNKT